MAAELKHGSRRTKARHVLARLGVGFVLMLPAAAGHYAVPLAHSTPPPLPASAARPSDRTFKLNLMQKMPKPPQLIIFGGSRATRFDPVLFQKLTGLTTFNCAFSNGLPTDAWAFTSFLMQQDHVKKLYCFWAIDPITFYSKQMDVGLLTDPRLARYFPEKELERQVPKQIAYAARGLPLFWDPSEYIADGQMTYNQYDSRLAHGFTLQKGLQLYISTQLGKRVATGKPGYWNLNQQYFVQTLGLFNSMGVTPVLVVMPTQPEVIAAMGKAQFERRRVSVLNFLESLRPRHRFALLDYSYIQSFGGDPTAFYDGVHIMVKNADLIIEAAVKAVPQAFK